MRGAFISVLRIICVLAAFFTLGFSTVVLADVKITSFKLTQLRDSCKYTASVEMLLNPNNVQWDGQFKYRGDNGSQKNLTIVADYAHTQCSQVMSASRCQGYQSYVRFSEILDFNGLPAGKVSFRLYRPDSEQTGWRDTPNCVRAVAPSLNKSLQKLQINPD